MSLRFYPLRDSVDFGVLAGGIRKQRAAMFLTLKQAKALQVRKERAA